MLVKLVFTNSENLMIRKKTFVFIGLLLFSPIILANKINPQCYDYLTELVKSSNFPFKEIPKKTCDLLIKADDHNTILAHINYDKQVLNIFSDTNKMAINGIIKYDTKHQQLYNISADIDPNHPVALSFNKEYAELFENCRKGIDTQNANNCTEINNKSLLNQTVFFPKKELKISQAGRTYFYSAPDENCKINNNLFIIKNDNIQVSGEFKGFYNVIYKKRNGGSVTGWIIKNNVTLPQENLQTTLFNKYEGDILVSNKTAIKSINKSCTTKNIYNRTTEQAEQDAQRCVLSQITFPYDQFLNLDNGYQNEQDLEPNKKIYIWQSNNFNIYIKETKKSLSEGNDYIEITLFTEKNNGIIDQLIIYKEQYDINAFFVKHQYYFIDPSLTLSILEVSTLEEGTLVDSWRNYKINNEGKIILVESMTCDDTINGKKTCSSKHFTIPS